MDFQTFYDGYRRYSLRWTLEIMAVLQAGPMRYTDLLHSITPPPSSKSFNEALRRLQDEDLVSHRTSGDVYRLTDAGRELLPILVGFGAHLQRWAVEHRDPRQRSSPQRSNPASD